MSDNNNEMRVPILKRITALEDIMVRVETAIAIICFSIMFVAVIIGVIMRFFLKAPNQYGEEISRYMMICGIFLGVSVGVNKGAHLSVDGIVSALPKSIANVISIIASLITTGVYFLLFVLAVKFTGEMHDFGQTSPAMGLPMYLVYTTILIGLLLSTIHSLLALLRKLFITRKEIGKEGNA